MNPFLRQIAPGVFVAEGGANQGIDNREAPGQKGVIPNLPLAFKRRAIRGLPGQSVVDLGQFAELNGELVVAVSNTQSDLVLPGPLSPRVLLGFRNSSAAAVSIYIAFGQPATTSSWLKLTQDVIVLLDTTVPQDDVYAIASGAGAQLTIVNAIAQATPGT